MADWLLEAIQESVYWLWCRWRGHGAFPVYEEWLTKGPDRVTFRVCAGCGRVYEQDVEPALDRLEHDLDELERMNGDA